MPRACPICRAAVADDCKHRPFCSGRCKDIDLGHWLSESYRIPRPMTEEEVEEALRAQAEAEAETAGEDDGPGPWLH